MSPSTDRADTDGQRTAVISRAMPWVARAAWVRTRLQGDTGLVRRLLGDADPEVRAAAWQAVRGV